jgi:hypothetical protein
MDPVKQNWVEDIDATASSDTREQPWKKVVEACADNAQPEADDVSGEDLVHIASTAG